MHRILLVEDDPDVGRLLEQVLVSAGYRVSKTASAEAAVLLLAHRSHDLILADVNLPDGNGVALADKGKELGAKTLLITSLSLRTPMDQLHRHDHLVKPFRPGELLAAIKRILGPP